MKQFVYLVQYLTLLPFVATAKILTIRQRREMAGVVGWFLYYFFILFPFFLKKRYSIFAKNLEIIHGRKLEKAEIKKHLKEYLCNTSLLFFESFAFQDKDIPWLKNNLVFDADFLKKLAELHKKGERIVISSIHIGNWELIHHYLTDVLNLKVALIYRKQNNEYFEKFLSNSRQKASTIDKKDKNAIKKISKLLDEKHIIMVLLDQRDISHGENIKICGMEAKIPTALVRYAIKTKCHILSGISFRNNQKIHIEIQNDLTPQTLSNKTTTEISQQLFDGFSTAIKTHTTQWYCLMHDLWKK